jgi:hypothetical protein
MDQFESLLKRMEIARNAIPWHIRWVETFLDRRDDKHAPIPDQETLDFLQDIDRGWTELVDETTRTLRLKHRTYKTEKAYLGWLERFRDFRKEKHPRDIGSQDIRDSVSRTSTSSVNASSYATPREEKTASPFFPKTWSPPSKPSSMPQAPHTKTTGKPGSVPSTCPAPSRPNTPAQEKNGPGSGSSHPGRFPRTPAPAW